MPTPRERVQIAYKYVLEAEADPENDRSRKVANAMIHHEFIQTVEADGAEIERLLDS